MIDVRLERFEDRLVLRDLDDPGISPVSVDFLAPALLHRLRGGLSKNQPLPKALGLRGVDGVYVIDATAGLGVDAFIMAAYGCRVRAFERSADVFALLEDGYARLLACGDSRLLEIASRLSFEHGDALTLLPSFVERPSVVYADPMYPEEGRSKSALPKKGMQLFKRLVGADSDADALVTVARAVALDRVVVKRPAYAPVGAGVAHSFESKTARFDMYLAARG